MPAPPSPPSTCASPGSTSIPRMALSDVRRYNFRMRFIGGIAFRACAAIFLLAANTPAQDRNGAQDIARRLAKWKNVDMPFRGNGLTGRERQMVDKLVEACRLLDDVYWRQSDLDGLALYKKTADPAVKTLLTIMGGRWDLID